MARIRSIKPEFCTSEQVAYCSYTSRLLFIESWMFCDDGGVMPYSLKHIKMSCFPGDFCSEGEVDGWVKELLIVGLYAEFEAEGRRWLYVTGWKKHQKIQKVCIKYPQPGSATKFVDHSDTSIGLVCDQYRTSTRPVRDHLPPELIIGNGKEGKGGELVMEGMQGEVRDERSHTSRIPRQHSTLPAAPPPSAGRAPKLKKNVLPEIEDLNKAAFAEWDCERRRRGGKSKASWSPLAQRKAAKLMARYTMAEQQAMVDASIAAGYQGLFPPNGKGNGAKTFKQIDAENAEAQQKKRSAAFRARHPEINFDGLGLDLSEDRTFEGEVITGDE